MFSGKGLTFSVSMVPDAIKKAVEAAGQDLAQATTDAMRETVTVAKNNARASVRSAGPGFRKWANAVRSEVYPKTGKSLKPAGAIWVRSDYAGIFERGGSIHGHPFIWIPLKGVPRFYQGERIRPGLLKGLITIKRAGKPPMLGIRVKATEARLNKAISTSLLSRGTAEVLKRRRGSKTRIRVIPLFIGVPTATIKKKWNVQGAAEDAMRELNKRILARL